MNSWPGVVDAAFSNHMVQLAKANKWGASVESSGLVDITFPLSRSRFLGVEIRCDGDVAQIKVFPSIAFREIIGEPVDPDKLPHELAIALMQRSESNRIAKWCIADYMNYFSFAALTTVFWRELNAAQFRRIVQELLSEVEDVEDLIVEEQS